MHYIYSAFIFIYIYIYSKNTIKSLLYFLPALVPVSAMGVYNAVYNLTRFSYRIRIPYWLRSSIHNVSCPFIIIMLIKVSYIFNYLLQNFNRVLNEGIVASRLNYNLKNTEKWQRTIFAEC
jgi:hypothetical protein